MKLRDMVIMFSSGVNGLLQLVGGAVLVGLLVVICADVGARYVLAHPFPGVTELVEQAIIVLVCLNVPKAIEKHAFVRSDGLLKMLSSSHPLLVQRMNLAFYLTGAVIFGLVALAIYPRMTHAFHRGLYVGVEGLATISIWPGLASIFVGAIFASLSYLLLILRIKEESF